MSEAHVSSKLFAVHGTRSNRWETCLESLLELALHVKHDALPEEVAEYCLQRVARLLPEHALGLRIVNRSTGAQFVRRCTPAGKAALAHDATRLFPNFTHEKVLELSAGLRGSTFHFATDVELVEEHDLEAEIAKKTALVIAELLRRSIAQKSAPDSSQLLAKLRLQLIQAEKLASLGQVVAGVVHELANPLTSIVAYSAYLKEKARRSSAADVADVERLGRISDSAERMLKFTRDLVAYARPADTLPTTVNLHDLIRKAVVFCEHEFSTNQVQVTLALDSSNAFVRGVHGPLTQVFVNLLTNAAHAMSSRGGQLCIESSHDSTGERLLVRITDHGVGIPEEILPQIFDPFFTTKPEREGTGLGLAIVQEILAAHQGEVKVSSTPGEGSTFVITLPCAYVLGSEPPNPLGDHGVVVPEIELRSAIENVVPEPKEV